MAKTASLIPSERIASSIYVIRGHRVMFDSDLAQLYGVETRELNQAVRRNIERFPCDFMFQVSKEEFANLKSQIVTSSWGGKRKPPSVFTEQGVAMLSSVLKSKRAVQANIQIIRTFPKYGNCSPRTTCCAGKSRPWNSGTTRSLESCLMPSKSS